MYIYVCCLQSTDGWLMFPHLWHPRYKTGLPTWDSLPWHHRAQEVESRLEALLWDLAIEWASLKGLWLRLHVNAKANALQRHSLMDQNIQRVHRPEVNHEKYFPKGQAGCNSSDMLIEHMKTSALWRFLSVLLPMYVYDCTTSPPDAEVIMSVNFWAYLFFGHQSSQKCRDLKWSCSSRVQTLPGEMSAGIFDVKFETNMSWS